MALPDLTRREFLKVSTAAGAGAAASLIINPFVRIVSAMAAPSAANYYGIGSFVPSIERTFDGHTHGDPRGIDFKSGHGVPTSVPVEGWAWVAGKHADGSKGLTMESHLGHRIDVHGQDEVYMQSGQLINPFMLAGPEGTGTWRVSGSMEEHMHAGIALPPFGKDFFRNKEQIFSYTDPYNGVAYHWIDPDKHSFASLKNPNGKLTDSWFTGDNSHQRRLLEEAVRKFEAIEGKHADTELAKFIRGAKKEGIRFFPQTLVAYMLLKEKLLENKQVEETVREYLHWHSNVNIGMFLPYPNPELKLQYVRPVNDPDKAERVAAKWDEMLGYWRQKDWNRVVDTLHESRKITPLGVFPRGGGEPWTERNIGTAYARLNRPDEAFPHLLAAWALPLFDGPQPDEKQLYFRTLYGALVRAAKRSDKPALVSYFAPKYQELKR